jgi:hypothetical protein
MLLDAANGKNQHWHLKKEVTVAHILSSLGVLGLVVTAWFSLQAAVATLDQRTFNVTDARISIIERDVHAIQRQVNSSLMEIKTELRSINDKLDDKADRPR